MLIKDIAGQNAHCLDYAKETNLRKGDKEESPYVFFDKMGVRRDRLTLVNLIKLWLLGNPARRAWAVPEDF